MFFSTFLKPFLAGISLGAFCFSYCFPFVASFITSENRTVCKNLGLICYFMLGRFLGYLAFGLIFGYLGKKLQSPVLNLITDGSLILISAALLLQILGVLRQKEDFCLGSHLQSRNAAVMGFFMGVNICPPFLLSLTYVFSLHDILQSVLYFVIFFFASSVYFLPMIFVGMLAKIKEIRQAARICGILTAGIFIFYAGYRLIDDFLILKK